VAEGGVHHKYQGEQRKEQSIHVQLLKMGKRLRIGIGLTNGKNTLLAYQNHLKSQESIDAQEWR
jgi:hypothetical protein